MADIGVSLSASQRTRVAHAGMSVDIADTHKKTLTAGSLLSDGALVSEHGSAPGYGESRRVVVHHRDFVALLFDDVVAKPGLTSATYEEDPHTPSVTRAKLPSCNLPHHNSSADR